MSKGFSIPDSPAKKHDGTTSSTTHYKDGSAKSNREVAFSKRHEAEVKKGAVARDFDDTYTKRKEQLLNQGFTQEDADHMIKNKAVTGEVDKEAKPEHPKYKKKSPIKMSAKSWKKNQKMRDEEDSTQQNNRYHKNIQKIMR